MNHDPALDGVVMTRLQIALQREIGGWPLYTIILALGQVGDLLEIDWSF
jgi:alpha-1,3-glucan synthase